MKIYLRANTSGDLNLTLFRCPRVTWISETSWPLLLSTLYSGTTSFDPLRAPNSLKGFMHQGS